MDNKINIEKELKKIQHLLAGILLKRSPNIKKVAKVIGCSDKTLTKMYPNKKGRKNAKTKKE